MKLWRFLVLFTLFYIGCKEKKDEAPGTVPFPVISFLQSQVRHVDTSVFSIVKVVSENDKKDTIYIPREAFRSAADAFLKLPDLTADAWKNKYGETKLYDEDLKKVILSYTPKDKAMAEGILRQDIIINPQGFKGDEVETIYTETLQAKEDSLIRQRMTWNVAGNFQVIRIAEKDGAEKVLRTDVRWANNP